MRHLITKAISTSCFGLLSIFAASSVSAAMTETPSTSQHVQVPQNTMEMKMSFSPLVKQTVPAVVNINTSRVVRQRVRSSPFSNDPFFDHFFGNNRHQGRDRFRDRVQSSLGSGVIVRSNGIIITNNHVIDNMTEIKVTLHDRREYDATVLLADERTDLAVLKIDARNLPTLEIANSDDAEVGDLVLAIGNPFGVGQSVTSGIISALARSTSGSSDFQFFIQTDAAINPGNSGGALIDVQGRLIGVNTQIFSRSGGSNGIGFAIPANMVKLVVESAENGGSAVRRPWIGASHKTVTSDIATALDLDKTAGSLVNVLLPDGPADRAGLMEGDVVVKFDGQDIFDSESLNYHIATKAVGERVPLTVIRDGTRKNLHVKLDLPPELPLRNTTYIDNAKIPFHGVTIANQSPALNEELQRPYTEQGVVVMDVERDKTASRLVKKGYRIISVNGVDIKSVAQFKEAVQHNDRFWDVKIEDMNGRVSRQRFNFR